MSKIIEEINEIKKKINEKLSSGKLKRTQTNEFLEEIKSDLKELEQNAEEGYKKIVSWKAKEIKAMADENIENEPDWIETQNDLSRIKGRLDELGNEIKEFERELNKKNEQLNKELEELAEWRKSFPKQNPEQAVENIKKFASEVEKKIEEERRQHKEQLDNLQMKLEKEGRKTNSPSLLELSNNVKEVGEKYVQVGVKAGGHIPLIEQIGGLCGLGGALYHGTLVSGMKIVDDGKEVYNKALDTGAGLMESTGKNLTQVTETFVDKGADMIKNIGGDIANVTGTIASNIADVNKKVVEEGSSLVKEGMKTGADTVENFRKGVENVTTEAMNNTTKVINESIDVAKKVVEGGIGAKYGDFEFGVNMGKGNVLEAKVESKDEIIARLEKQLEEQKLELTKKQEQINFLQQQQAEAQKTSGQTGLAALQLAQTLAANK